MSKTKTLSKLKQDAQIVFNMYVRLRDQGKPCISCGSFTGTQAGHYFSVGAYGGLRFNEDNCHLQCPACNMFKHGNLIEYGLNLRDRIGQERYDRLIEDSRLYKMNGYKFTRTELIELKKTYQQKIKNL